MGTIGGTELIIVLVIVMVLFGASTIPKLAKSIGQAKREFEQGIKEADKKPQKLDSSSSKPTIDVNASGSSDESSPKD